MLTTCSLIEQSQIKLHTKFLHSVVYNLHHTGIQEYHSCCQVDVPGVWDIHLLQRYHTTCTTGVCTILDDLLFNRSSTHTDPECSLCWYTVWYLYYINDCVEEPVHGKLPICGVYFSVSLLFSNSLLIDWIIRLLNNTVQSV